MMPLMPLPIRQRLTQARLVASATAGSSTGAAAPVTVPAAVRAGDLLIFVSYVEGTPVNTVPAGFNRRSFNPSSGWSGAIVTSTKIADGTEAGTSIVGGTGTTATGNILLVIRGEGPISAASKVGEVWTQSNNNPGAVTAPAASAVGPCLALGAIGSVGASPYPAPNFESQSPAFVSAVAAPNLLRVGLNFYAEGSTPVGQLVDVGDNGVDNYITAYFLNLTGG